MNSDLEGKNLVELLDMLEPVPDPAPISLIPQTPGWVVLGIVVLGLIFWIARRITSRRQARAYRRAALVELAGANDDVARIATVLRRTALAGFPRAEVAGLTGVDWLNFLDQSYDGKGFSGDAGQVLLTAPYRENTADPAFTDLARKWITTHRTTHRQVHP